MCLVLDMCCMKFAADKTNSCFDYGIDCVCFAAADMPDSYFDFDMDYRHFAPDKFGSYSAVDVQ
ncbi:MAG: hypothetical protein IKJ68_07420 [Clostridia bacterium]|nr:hypothetical protein [Clostridia bacterium]